VWLDDRPQREAGGADAGGAADAGGRDARRAPASVLFQSGAANVRLYVHDLLENEDAPQAGRPAPGPAPSSRSASHTSRLPCQGIALQVTLQSLSQGEMRRVQNMLLEHWAELRVIFQALLPAGKEGGDVPASFAEFAQGEEGGGAAEAPGGGGLFRLGGAAEAAGDAGGGAAGDAAPVAPGVSVLDLFLLARRCRLTGSLPEIEHATRNRTRNPALNCCQKNPCAPPPGSRTTPKTGLREASPRGCRATLTPQAPPQTR
jgi:hypothetical protein